MSIGVYCKPLFAVLFIPGYQRLATRLRHSAVGHVRKPLFVTGETHVSCPNSRSIGRLDASACTILSQRTQANFGRTCWITLKCSGTYSSISETSSPRDFTAAVAGASAAGDA